MARHLGLDLGGTNIKFTMLESAPGLGQGGDSLSIIGSDSITTEAHLGPDHVVERLIEAGHAAFEAWGVPDSIGMGVPGFFNADAGTIELFPNLPGAWRGYPIVANVCAGLGQHVALVNDCRAFTLAETRMGAAGGCRNVVCFVLGTGIGGGMIIDGRLRYGRDGRAGELGHLIVEPGGQLCGCGRHGCVEAYASAGPFARAAGQATPADAIAAAGRGDAQALAAIDQMAKYLGIAIANMITAVLPERVVIGGGIAQAGDLLLDAIRAATHQYQITVPPDWYDIVTPTLGPFAGAVGAALWGREHDVN